MNSNIIKIGITGPESSGKTTLARWLSRAFETVWVPEYAREYLDTLQRPYVYSDLVEIAKGQMALEKKYAKEAKTFLFTDTDLLVIKIWSEYKYGMADKYILDNLKYNIPQHYFLCAPDIPWEPDPLRESRYERFVLFKIYEKELIKLKIPFTIIEGSREDRLSKCMEVLEGIEKPVDLV